VIITETKRKPPQELIEKEAFICREFNYPYTIVLRFFQAFHNGLLDRTVVNIYYIKKTTTKTLKPKRYNSSLAALS
jgi:hypothetical protein